MNLQEFRRLQDRRAFLQRCAGGFGSTVLAHLMASEGLTAGSADRAGAPNPLAPKEVAK
jgi:hypothetical protein